MPPPAQPPKNFLEILQRVWWRLDRALDENSLRASARYAIADALLNGTTALVDHHESPDFIEGSLDVLATCAQELGIRLAVGYGATERNGGREEAKRGLAECERFLRSNQRTFVRGMVALHASFTVSDDTIREAGELARKFGAPMHVHVAEDAADVVDARQRGYAGPLERLLELGGLPEHSVVAHGVHLRVEQVKRARAAGLWLVQNPRSNEGNQVGYPAALHASDRVALGTDGWPANMALEAAALMRLGGEHGDSNDVLEARTRAGHALATELFEPEKLGELKPNASADVVVGIPGEPPRHVVVGGRRVVIEGRLMTGDFAEIRAKALEAAPELWKRMEQISPLPAGERVGERA
jgi:cytosine/adenosine deaminase-related metal-dependent hydrolase